MAGKAGLFTRSFSLVRKCRDWIGFFSALITVICILAVAYALWYLLYFVFILIIEMIDIE